MKRRRWYVQPGPLGAVLVASATLVACDDNRVHSIPDHWVHDFEVSPDGTRLLLLVKEHGGAELRRLEVYGADAAWAPDGTVALSRSAGACQWDFDRDGPLTCIDAAQGYHVAWLPDGARLVNAGYYDTSLWDVSTGEQIAHFDEQAVASIALSGDGRRLVVSSSTPRGEPTRMSAGARAGAGRRVRVWNASTGEKIADLVEYSRDIVNSVTISWDGSRVAAGLAGGDVLVWDGHTAELLNRVGYAGTVNDLALTADGRRVLVAFGKKSGGPFTHPGRNAVDLLDTTNGAAIELFERDRHVIEGVRLTPDGRQAVLLVKLPTGDGSRPCEIHVLDLPVMDEP
jgi:WD40 repeat protein